jgi:hypothetical protein
VTAPLERLLSSAFDAPEPEKRPGDIWTHEHAGAVHAVALHCNGHFCALGSAFCDASISCKLARPGVPTCGRCIAIVREAAVLRSRAVAAMTEHSGVYVATAIAPSVVLHAIGNDLEALDPPGLTWLSLDLDRRADLVQWELHGKVDLILDIDTGDDVQKETPRRTLCRLLAAQPHKVALILHAARIFRPAALRRWLASVDSAARRDTGLCALLLLGAEAREQLRGVPLVERAQPLTAEGRA